MNAPWQDTRYGVRMLLRSPGFTAVVLLVIGVGIAANAALFNALDQVYMRPLPVKDPDGLVSVQFHYRHGRWEEVIAERDYTVYEAYRDRSGMFATLAAFQQQNLTLRHEATVEPIEAAAVSDNYFSTLGLGPALGRLIEPPSGQSPDAYQPVAVLGHRLWQRRFAGRTDVIGKEIVVNDRALTIVGVTPAGFTGTVVGRPVDIYTSLGITGQSRDDFGGVYQLGRLRPGVTRQQAQTALQILYAQLDPHKPGGPQVTPLVVDGRQGIVPSDARVTSYPLALFMGIAALVLVIACANVANLQLSRAMTRQKEIAIRLALGAGRRRIVRQLLVESLLLALAAGACGTALAVGLDRIVCTFLPQLVSANMPPEMQVHITPGLHPRVLLFVMAIAVGTGIAFGLAPALQLVRRDVVPALKESSGPIATPARRWNPHNLLVVGQIAVSVVVIVCSGLCLRSLIGLKSTDPGFDPAHILAVEIEHDGWLLNRPELRRFMENLHERVNRLPGVQSAALTLTVPLCEGGSMSQVTHIESCDMPPHAEINQHMGYVCPGYFQTIGQRLLAGRDFTDRDGPDGANVTVVDSLFAKRYWPNEDPIGKRITFGRADPTEPPLVREVVGVVTAVKLRSIIEESRPWIYCPLAQRPEFTPVLLARTDGDPKSLIPAIRKAAAAIPPAPTCHMDTVAERISGLLLPQSILTGILNSFALVGLLLSATGIYAVMAYAVKQRTRELGIRIALGAQDRHILTPVMRRGGRLLASGLVLGLGLSLAGGRVLTALLPHIRRWDKFFLHGIGTGDLLTYVTAALTITAVTLLACYIPARRATKVDPMEALRYE